MGKIFRVGKLPFNGQLGAYYMVLSFGTSAEAGPVPSRVQGGHPGRLNRRKIVRGKEGGSKKRGRQVEIYFPI